MKTAAQFFGEDLLPYAGVKGRIARVAPTEHVHLEMRRLEEDFNFIMEKGAIRHLEFESDSITEQDLRRFREYEAATSRAYKVDIVTYVICSADVKELLCELKAGINTYRVEVIRLKGKDADPPFQCYRRKEGKRRGN